jgi:hypothetical protein
LQVELPDKVPELLIHSPLSQSTIAALAPNTLTGDSILVPHSAPEDIQAACARRAQPAKSVAVSFRKDATVTSR